MKQYPEFDRYTIEQLRADLDALVEWKNLTPMQDPRKVKTIAEYKNRQFRYSMSEYAVEIERMTVKLENLFLESATLSGGLFGRLYARPEWCLSWKIRWCFPSSVKRLGRWVRLWSVLPVR